MKSTDLTVKINGFESILEARRLQNVYHVDPLLENIVYNVSNEFITKYSTKSKFSSEDFHDFVRRLLNLR